MTHDELRDCIDKFDCAGMVNEPIVKALRVVVEFHKPFDFTSGEETFTACYCGEFYPCPTIQAIEGELNGQI